MDVVNEINRPVIPELNFQPQPYYDCIESINECASSCWISADAFMNERNNQELKNAIRLCLTSAEVCAATAKALVMHDELPNQSLIAQLKECIEICQMCSQECSHHCDEHEHCLICVRCCEECIRMCQAIVA